ncbi:MAG: hypothetical protein ACRYG4_14845 [Janthinobacterium lividum]
MRGDGGAPLDVALALRQVVLTFWSDFAPIVLLGFVMVTLPAVAQRLIGSHSGSTVVATFGGMLTVLYVVIVTVGTMARLSGRPLTAAAFVRVGIAASPPGLSVGLLLGAGVVLVLVALLFTGFSTPAEAAGSLAIVVGAFAGIVTVVPAMSAAIVERRKPFAAVARGAALTRGSRARIAALLIVLGLAVVPTRLVIAASIYGLGVTTAQQAAADATMTVFSPGLWLLALFDLLAWGLAATVPGVVYVQLAARK